MRRDAAGGGCAQFEEAHTWRAAALQESACTLSVCAGCSSTAERSEVLARPSQCTCHCPRRCGDWSCPLQCARALAALSCGTSLRPTCALCGPRASVAAHSALHVDVRAIVTCTASRLLECAARCKCQGISDPASALVHHRAQGSRNRAGTALRGGRALRALQHARALQPHRHASATSVRMKECHNAPPAGPRGPLQRQLVTETSQPWESWRRAQAPRAPAALRPAAARRGAPRREHR